MIRTTRRFILGAAALGPVAGCSVLDDLFTTEKIPIEGKRESVLATARGTQMEASDRRAVTLPPAIANAEWAQPGGVPSHVMGNLSTGDLTRSWHSSIGESGGYRARITAMPVVGGNQVFTMDPDGMVSAFDVATGSRQWTTDTQGEDDRSTNVGGGLALAKGVVYAATGRGEVMTLDPRTGKIGWRSSLDAPARSGPTVVDNRLFVPTIDERLLALDTASGKRLWSYQATATSTSVLGVAAPAYADGLVVAGFGSGDLVALRAESGTLAWTDSLAAARGRNSLLDLSAIRALPLISGGVVYAISLGSVLAALDLRSGRRLWEREIAGQHTPCLAGDWLFLLSEDQTMLCIAKADGRVRWSSQLPRYGDPDKSRDPIFWSGPLLSGAYLYAAGSTEKLVAVNAATGEILGQQELRGAAAFAPIAASGKMFIVTNDGSLTALG